MSFRVLLIAVVLLTTLTALGQITNGGIQNEVQLVAALCRTDRDQRSRELLLSQSPQLVNDRLWRQLMGRASAAYYGPTPRESLSIYELAIDIARQLHNPKLLATTYYNLGRTHSALNQIPNAIEDYQKSQESFEQAGSQRDLIYVLADLGAFYFILEDYQKARDCSEKSISLADKLKITHEAPAAFPDDFGRARALLTLGEDDSRNGAHEEAIRKLEQSLALYQGLNARSHSYDFYIGGVYGALARAYAEAGESARALLCLNGALVIATGQADSKTIASLRNDMGFLYLEQEDYAQAKAQFEEGLKIYVTDGNKRDEARVLSNLGVVEQRRGSFSEALKYFRLSLQAAKTSETPNVQIASYEGIGVVLTAVKDFRGAIQSLGDGLAIAKRMSDKTRQAEILWRTAQAYYAVGNYSQSNSFAMSAVSLAQATRSPKLTYLATATLGQSYAALKKIDLAIETLKQAVGQIETIRNHVAGRDEERQLFFEDKLSPYHTLIDLLVLQGRADEALVYAERAKGRVLLDILEGGKRDLAKGMTPAEKEQSQRLNRKIFEVNERIRKEETNSALNALQSQLDAARLEYASFQDSLYVAHPELSARTGRTGGLTNADLERLTSNGDCAYLEYVVAKDRVSLFVLTRGEAGEAPELKIYPVAARPAELLQKVNQFHDALSAKRPTYVAVARQLFALLVRPAEQQLRGIETFCIVPDGFLWNVPFQALMTKDDHYLLEDHAVYYAPSLSVLGEMNKEDKPSKKTFSLIAFGNPVIGKDEQHNTELCPLQEAEAEVASVAKTFEPFDNRFLIGRQATEKTFKELAPKYSVIHLATHGVINNREPLYSHVQLTKTDGDQENDGLLEAREIMEMNLRADLAVLSACETANGKISPGEGVMGMSWAFFVAGARSMLVSQWRIDSGSTSQLMETFYQDLNSDRQSGNARKAQAIREAALRLQMDDRYHHPFFWAGFVLVGVN